MDEEISIIDKRTRNEKVKNFFVDNKKKIIFGILSIILLIFFFILMKSIKKDLKISYLINIITLLLNTKVAINLRPHHY